MNLRKKASTLAKKFAKAIRQIQRLKSHDHMRLGGISN